VSGLFSFSRISLFSTKTVTESEANWSAGFQPACCRKGGALAGKMPALQADWRKPRNGGKRRWLLGLRLLIFAPMSEPASAPQPPSKAQVFLRRFVSTVFLWTVILTALFSGYPLVSNGVFLLLIALLALSGLVEFYGIAEKRGMVNFKWSGVIGGLLLMVGTFLNVTGHLGTSGSPARVNDFETSFLILFVLGLCVRQFVSKSNTAGLTAIATTLFGLMYVPWLLNFIQKISFFPFPAGSPADAGKYFLLYFILVTKFSDMGAYAVGSLVGKHKMIPRISPGKTWEGFGGAILVSTGASLAFVHFFGAKMVGMNYLHAVILGVVLSVAAVIGDLIESIFKREAGVKDSGKLFPGIGGILDLLDSLLFNAPLMYLYLRHILTHP
jgi:phosphatidate cytidylyltransferase